MQVNYTTYDMRREYDIVNPRKHSDIMTVSSDFDPSTGSCQSGHPFRYARVLGIYHADVIHILPGHEASLHTVQFLWVQWYTYDTSYKAGFKYRRLHRLAPMPLDNPLSCGFLDPDDIVRGVHLIPVFAHGTAMDFGELGAHTSNQSSSELLPWKLYYVNL